MASLQSLPQSYHRRLLADVAVDGVGAVADGVAGVEDGVGAGPLLHTPTINIPMDMVAMDMVVMDMVIPMAVMVMHHIGAVPAR